MILPVDAVDVHAFAMFQAGWRACLVYLADGPRLTRGVDDCELAVDADPQEPTPTRFYLAVPAPKDRECGVGKVVAAFTADVQSLQARARDLHVQATKLDAKARSLASQLLETDYDR